MSRQRRKYTRDFDEGYSRGLKPETRKGIFGILFLLLAALSLLSLLSLSGQLGLFIEQGLSLLFGVVKWGVPLIFVVLSYSNLASEHESKLGVSGYIGLVLLILSLNAFIHTIKIPHELPWTSFDLMHAGGYTGIVLAIPLLSATGKIAAPIILVSLFIISLLLILNTSLHQLGRVSFFWVEWLRRLTHITSLFQRAPKKYYEEDENEQGDDVVSEERNTIVGERDTMFEKKQIPSVSAAQSFTAPQALITRRKRKVDLPLDLLDNKIMKANSGDTRGNSLKIKKALQNFGIEVELGEMNIGPAVTQYTVKPAEGVKLSRITALSDDLALALAAHPIRIEAPIPGKSLVGIEVPNQTTAIVGLKEVLVSSEFIKRKNNLTIALGKDVSGTCWTADLSNMPHLLIAGATGSGKTICINSIIVSLLYQNGPDDLKFLMVDPKRVELHLYNGIPHLITPVITDIKKTVNALKWCIAEMDRRFEILSKTHRRDISSYNRDTEAKMPYLVVVIDELADLMATSSHEVEACIIRLSQMARAVGIHLILATQRPSVDVITGLIKANITARIAFSVASIMDSRTILDTSGADKLLGRGDMLFVNSQLSKPKRIQGVFVSEEETKRISAYLKEKYETPDYNTTVTDTQSSGKITPMGEGVDDVLYEDAKRVVIESKKASASLLQRRLKIGYARAARLIDILEENGIVGPGDGAKPREILIDAFSENDMIDADGFVPDTFEDSSPEYETSDTLREEEYSEEFSDVEDEVVEDDKEEKIQ